MQKFSLTNLEHRKHFCNSIGVLYSLQIQDPAYAPPFPFLPLIHQVEAYFPYRSLAPVRFLLGQLPHSHTSQEPTMNIFFVVCVPHFLMYLFIFQTVGSYFLKHSSLRDTVKAKGPPPMKVKIYSVFSTDPHARMGSFLRAGTACLTLNLVPATC